jgi:hypothetical protein
MIVEPIAADSLAENINPVGRVYYGFSTMLCTPWFAQSGSRSCPWSASGERRLRSVLSKGGFTRVRCAAETPFNMILEARAYEICWELAATVEQLEEEELARLCHIPMPTQTHLPPRSVSQLQGAAMFRGDIRGPESLSPGDWKISDDHPKGLRPQGSRRSCSVLS